MVNSVSIPTFLQRGVGQMFVYAPYILFMRCHENVGPFACFILLVAFILRFAAP